VARHRASIVEERAAPRAEEEVRGAQSALASGSAAPEKARGLGILILAVLAVAYTLYFAAPVILPITMALVLKLLLQPAMRILADRLRLPLALAALLLILAVFGAMAIVATTISVPAASWMQKAPQSFPILEQKLAVLKQPIDLIRDALQQVESAASGSGTLTVQQGAGIAANVFSLTAATLAGFFTTMLVLFFLLASGDRLLRGLVEVLPKFRDKRQAVEIAAEIETNIAGYLMTITMMNALVAIATGLAMHLCGVSDPVLWGAIAFLLNYVPILGPLTGIGIFFLVGLLSFDSLWHALLPAGLYLGIHIAEGEAITPMLLARRFTLNPVLIIVSLFVWHAIWGVPGMLLAVPLLAIFKIIADRLDPLRPIAHIIGS
jgi:predicted PurR-regulated permease PerM